MIISDKNLRHLSFFKSIGSKILFRSILFSNIFKLLKTTVTVALALITLSTPVETLASAKSISCEDSFASNAVSLTDTQIAEELFNFKLLYFKLNEQRRLQPISSGFANGHSISSIEAELQTRKVRLLQLGLKTSDLVISPEDLLKIRGDIQADIDQEVVKKTAVQTENINSKLWSWQRKIELKRDFSHSSFSPDGSKILTIDNLANSTLKILDAKSLEDVKPISDPHEFAQFSSDSSQIIAVLNSPQKDFQRIRIYEANDPLKSKAIGDGRFFTFFAQFSPDKKTVFSLEEKGDKLPSGTQWDLKTNKPLLYFGDPGVTFYRSTVSRDNSLITTLSLEGTIETWDLANASASSDGIRRAIRKDRLVHDDAFMLNSSLSPDAKSFARTNPENKRVDVFQIDSNGKISSHKTIAEGQEFYWLAYSPDSRLLGIGTINGRVIIYDNEANKIQAEFQVSDSMVEWISFSFDNKSLVVHSADKKISLWHYDNISSGGVQ